jgi:hypothetical protein
MNWGSKIAVVFSGFVLFIIGMVGICMKQDDIHLVTEKYYEKEIAYQEQIDIENNTLALQEKPYLEYATAKNIVTVFYPEAFKNSDIKGNILFFRPADAKKDFTVPVTTDNVRQEISVADLDKGLWRIKMEWTSADKTYFLEERLVLQ